MKITRETLLEYTLRGDDVVSDWFQASSSAFAMARDQVFEVTSLYSYNHFIQRVYRYIIFIYIPANLRKG